MILPSDDNSTPEKRPKSRKSDANPQPPAGDEPEEAGAPAWMPEELWKQLPDMMGEASSLIDESEWREMLELELAESIKDLENFPDPECDFDPPDPPDLYAFHAELIALRQAVKVSQEQTLKHLSGPKPGLSQALAVQLGLLAGELRAGGNEAHAERLLKLIESFS